MASEVVYTVRQRSTRDSPNDVSDGCEKRDDDINKSKVGSAARGKLASEAPRRLRSPFPLVVPVPLSALAAPFPPRAASVDRPWTSTSRCQTKEIDCARPAASVRAQRPLPRNRAVLPIVHAAAPPLKESCLRSATVGLHAVPLTVGLWRRFAALRFPMAPSARREVSRF
ncbi:hypothetical protein MRX96_026269 [Rhipicephalus microplus]